jgi:adenine-specific DNA-methyltransferase
VIHEDSIHIKGSPNAKAPDYAFRLGGVRKFFVEAKKPAEDIQNTKEYAYQLKIYAWNAGLPLSILTDFEEFAVYDCRSKPNISDSPATGRVMYVRYDEYLDRWDEIAGIFSPDAIRKGAFDKYAEDNTAKKGTISVDDAFLEEIETWRTLLARNIALRNQQVINERQLNYAVQMTIDRIIFLRICEDQGIEPQNQLLELLNADDIYKRLVVLYDRADLKYNSGLFHFKAEAGNTNNVDTFTPTLTIDDKVLKEIIKSLYYPCPYVFKEIPVEILGQVYEQFLGKVIRLTPGHRAKIEEKPEVRKAGGVYYTPKYIVDYIVENTVGKLLEGKTPADAEKLKIVDPACGSGSFLLGAFQYLMDWHEDYYLANDPEKWTKGRDPALIQTADGDWRLTTEEKKRILVNNIHGVDIDQQAVEVTKLSLLLKVLEEETGQLTLGFERALPDLNDNIKCGNSLIGWDYFEGQLLPSEDEVARVNPFDWEKNFPDIFENGGFDAVIGNPPYIKEYTNSQPFHDLKGTSIDKYYQGKMDIWYVFACLAIDLLRVNGLHSFIATNNWITNSGASILREKIMSETIIVKFIDFGDYMIFEDASIQTMVYVLKKNLKTKPNNIEYKRIENSQVSLADITKFLYQQVNSKNFSYFLVDQENLKKDGSIFTFNPIEDEKILQKIDDPSYYRLKKNEVAQGIVLPQESVLKRHLPKLRDKNIEVGDGVFLLSTEELSKLELSDEELKIIKPFYTSSELDRYYANSKNKYWLIYSDRKVVNEINKYPKIKKHLNKFSSIITSDNKPYGLHRSREERFFLGEKILSIRKTDKPKFSLVDFPCYVSQTYYVIKPKNINLKYLLGILNSKLIYYWLDKKGKKQGDALQIDKAPILKIPINFLNLKNDSEKNYFNQMVSLVEHMLAIKKRKPQTPFEQEQLQREIDATDAQIDRLVYELYGLTEEEIKIVEGETRV